MKKFGMWMAVGTGIGAAIGVARDDIPVGIGGTAMAIVAGRRRKK